MNDSAEFEESINKDKYQVFLLVSRATAPFSFARHPWFVVNKKGDISRWEIFLQREKCRSSWGHLHRDYYPPFNGIEMFFFSDKYFFKPQLVQVIEGDRGSVAEKMGSFLENSPQRYPYCDTYSLLSPNSCTYAQWVLNEFPESGMRLPWNSRIFKGFIV